MMKTDKYIEEYFAGVDLGSIVGKTRVMEVSMNEADEQLLKPTTARRRRNEEEDELEEVYQEYNDTVGKYLKKYEESKKDICIYKLILYSCSTILHFSRRTANAETKHDEIIHSLVGNGIKIDKAVSDIIMKFAEAFYANYSPSSICILKLCSLDMLNKILMKCISKGVDIDEEILELLNPDPKEGIMFPTSNFSELALADKEVELYYIPGVNSILMMHISKCSHGIFKGIEMFNREIDKKPDVSKSEVDEANSIIINGKNYSKSTFESIVECNLDCFLNNLEIESELELRNIADSVVDSGEFKLI